MKQLRLYYGVFLLVGILASFIHAQYRLDEMTMMMKIVFENQREMPSKSEETKEDVGIMKQRNENLLLKEEETMSAIDRMENKMEILTQKEKETMSAIDRMENMTEILTHKEEETMNAIDRMENMTETLTQKEEDDGCTSTLVDLLTSFKSDDSPPVSDEKVKQHDMEGPTQEEWVSIIKDLSVDTLPKLLEEKNYTLHSNQTGGFKLSVVTYNHTYEIHANWTSKIYMQYHVQGHQTNVSIVTVQSVLVNDYFSIATGTFATKQLFKEEGKPEDFAIWSGITERWFFMKNFNGTYDLIGNSATTDDGIVVMKNNKTAEVSYHTSYLVNASNSFSLSFQDVKETMKVGKGFIHCIGSANQSTEILNVTQDVTGMKQTILLDQILQSSSRPSDHQTSSKFRGAVAFEDEEYSMDSIGTTSGSWGNVTMALYLKGYYCQDGVAPIKTEEQNPLNSLLKIMFITI